MLKLISFCVCVLILIGVLLRRNRFWHVRLMLAAFTVDMLLVLYIEMTRKAIDTALSVPHPFMIFHIVVSVIVVVLYLAQIFTGYNVLKKGRYLKVHRYLAMAFIVLRITNFSTSLHVHKFKTVQPAQPMQALLVAPRL